MSATVIELAPRHLAVLRAVAAGRAELTCSCEPDLYVDGRCCTDHTVAGLLARAGLITSTTSARCPAGRVPAAVTDAGRAALAARPASAHVPTRRNEPGEPSPGRVCQHPSREWRGRAA